MELLQKIKDIYEDADKNWNHGYGLLKYLDENNDLQGLLYRNKLCNGCC